MMTQIVAIKRELDKAVQERMKLSQIYSRHTNNSIAVSVAGAYRYQNNSCYDARKS
jgi:hypothetical protein